MNASRFPAVALALSKGRVLADNAGGAQLPDTAVGAMNTYLRQSNAQKGAVFTRCEYTSEVVASAKHGIAELLGVDPQGIVFGPNATTLAFALARAFAGKLAAGARIIVTAADHQANVAPWMWLQRFGAQIAVVPVDSRGDLDEEAFRTELERGASLVALPWSSNVTGTVYDVAHFAALAKAAGAIVIADGVQALPHLPITIDPAIDAAFFSAYKAFGPHFGFAYVRSQLREQYLQADDAITSGNPMAWTMETGTQCYEAIVGWTGTLHYLGELGSGAPRAAFTIIEEYESRLSSFARTSFAERAATIELYGKPPSEERLPVFAFNVRDADPWNVAEMLDEAGIEARIGDFYSPRLMKAVAPQRPVALRLSFAHYNTPQDVERCFFVLDEITRKAPGARARA